MTLLSDPALFDHIADAHLDHARTTAWWKAKDEQLISCREELRCDLEERNGTVVGPLGFVRFSHVSMGAISSLDLFGLDELIIFSFYWRNRHRYANVIDMGANIGLHSVVLALGGGSVVTAYEPDPKHVAFLRTHLQENGVEDLVTVRQAAVSRESGRLEFVRVLGNTTGSHLAGAKKDPYGELEVFEVDTVGVSDAVANATLVKMDVEGLESELLTALPIERFSALDLICEVGTAANAETVWHHFVSTDVNLFSQKRGWARVESIDDLPVSYKEGSLFISMRDSMPWEDS